MKSNLAEFVLCLQEERFYDVYEALENSFFKVGSLYKNDYNLLCRYVDKINLENNRKKN